MKAIIPCAGLGTRLRPHTLTTPKVLLHVAGRPILAHILDELAAAGVEQVVLVTGHLGGQIEEWARGYDALDIQMVEQAEALGNGHAVYVAREHLDEGPVILLFGDTIVRAHLPDLLARPYSVAGVREVEDPRRFGVVELDDEGWVRRLVEKPEIPPSHLAVVGLYLIRDAALLRDSLERLIEEDRRARGEFWLVDALQLMLDAGERMGTFPITHWYDCGTIDALLQANRELLDLDAPPAPPVDDAVVIPPSAVSPRAEVRRSVVGPYVSIGAGASVVDSIVRDSVIHPHASVRGAVLSGSVIGAHAQVQATPARLNLGDHSDIRSEDAVPE